MDGKDGLILWTLGGAGTLLLYAAYANKSPRTVLANTLGTTPPPDAGTAPSKVPAAGAGLDVSATPPAGVDARADGMNYLWDADGNMAGVVPAPYQGSAATYIPPRGGFYSA